MLSQKWKNILWSTLITILGIACFPANPLILTGIIEVDSYTVLFIIGCVLWAFGMVLVMAPIIIFPRQGRIPKGKSFIKYPCSSVYIRGWLLHFRCGCAAMCPSWWWSHLYGSKPWRSQRAWREEI